MTPEGRSALRGSSAHVIVDDVGAPSLDDDDRHHLARVLRLADGSMVSVTDGRGGWRMCRFEGGGVVPITETVVEEARAVPVTVAVAIPKQDRPEWIVQKLTELGVDRVVFLQADRSVVRWDTERSSRHLAKLQRVAREASRQSRRVWLPSIEGPVGTPSFLPSAVVAHPDGMPDDGSASTIAVGPEGGWTDREVEMAAGVVSLGSTILRVETAALAAAVLRRPMDG
ncbi:MAG: putative ribosomal small subunit methyltransferase [Actinomycetota bacterium]